MTNEVVIKNTLAVLTPMWRMTGKAMVLIAEDQTSSVIPGYDPSLEITNEKKMRAIASRLMSRGPIYLRPQQPETGEYLFIALRIGDKEKMGSLIGLINSLSPRREVYHTGHIAIEREDCGIVSFEAAIPNIPSAQSLIEAYAGALSDKLGTEVTPIFDRIPLACLSGRVSKDYCYKLGLWDIARITGKQYDEGEQPMPPSWAAEINFSKDPESADTFAYVKDTPIVQRNGITLISGAAKSGKTLLVSSMIAAIVKGGQSLGISAGSPGRILWCDTEQSESDLATVRKRIEKMADRKLTDSDIYGIRLRSFNPEDSTKIIENGLRRWYPDILIIDGPGDLCPDTNDISSSQATVKNLLRWADEYNCAVVAVVHTNPGSEKTRGHIGSEIERKCAFSMMTVKDNTDPEQPCFKVKAGLMRGKPFPTFAIGYDGNTPTIIGVPDQKLLSDKDRILGELEKGFSYSYSRLLEIATSLGLDEKKAKSTVAILAREKRLVKESDGSYVVVGL